MLLYNNSDNEVTLFIVYTLDQDAFALKGSLNKFELTFFIIYTLDQGVFVLSGMLDKIYTYTKSKQLKRKAVPVFRR